MGATIESDAPSEVSYTPSYYSIMNSTLPDPVSLTGFSWPILTFTMGGIMMMAYAIVRAFEVPVRHWEDDHDA